MSTEAASPAVETTVDAIKSILEPASVPVPGTEAKPAPATPPAAAETPPKDGPSDQDASEDEDKSEPKRKASTRISELYGQKKAAERLAAQHAEEVQKLRAQLDEMRRTTDPNDYAAVQKNDIRAAVKEERLAQLEQETATQIRGATELRQQGFMAKVDAAKERIPDIATAVQDFAKLPVSDYAADIISESDKAPEIAYYLAKNPDEALEIASLPPWRQGAAIARIEARVSVGQSRKTSNAPPPVPMIGGSSAPSTPSVQDMGVEDISRLIYGRS